MKRRDALATLIGAGGAAAAGLGVSGCSRVAQRFVAARPAATPRTHLILPPERQVAPATRLLNRAAFGPAPGDVERVARLGDSEWVEEQLAAPIGDTDENIGLILRLRGIDAIEGGPAYDMLDVDETFLLGQLEQASILRAVYSRWQLRERMVDFWSNHFNVYAHKGIGTYLKTTDDVQVVRMHALGSFPEMLKASAHSPAMLGYLDNQQNRKGRPNENYARELMELHTLGVGGGYTQRDVQEVARCLSGWTIETRFLRHKGTFRFDESQHDTGAKTVLGTLIPAGGGVSDGERVLDILTQHPSCARFIAGKMVRYFVGAEAGGLTARVAKEYTKTGGNIPAMLRVVLTAPEMNTAAPVMKRPFDFLVSALRATDAETDAGRPVREHLAHMGQSLFQWPMPDGYPDKTGSWTGSLLARWNFAVALATGALGNRTTVKFDAGATSWDGIMESILGHRADDPAFALLRSTLAAHAGSAAEAAALTLASPEFQWR